MTDAGLFEASPRQPLARGHHPPGQPGLNERASVGPQWAFERLVPLRGPHWQQSLPGAHRTKKPRAALRRHLDGEELVRWVPT